MLIRYVAFYDIDPENSVRNVSPAAVNKVNYIVSGLRRIGCNVEIVSPTWRVKPGELATRRNSNESTNVRFAPLSNYLGLLSGLANALFINIWLFFYLCTKLKRREKVLVYHSLVIIPAILAARLIKSLNIVLEVEELYTSVGAWRPIFKYLETNYIAKTGASYLLSTEMLEELIPNHKMRVLVYGPYFLPGTPSAKAVLGPSPIKLLYAGIIDKDKRGAFNALRAASHLDERYELRIIGFGDVDNLLLEITECNSRNNCKAFYDGYLSGSKFEEYCSSFDIGLSTQSSSGAYLSSSFPSKVLTYLLLGMRVVSPYIACVANSAVGHLVNYYSNDDPAEIARSIRSVNLDDGFNCSDELKRLDEEFCMKLGHIFQ